MKILFKMISILIIQAMLASNAAASISSQVQGEEYSTLSPAVSIQQSLFQSYYAAYFQHKRFEKNFDEHTLEIDVFSNGLKKIWNFGAGGFPSKAAEIRRDLIKEVHPRAVKEISDFIRKNYPRVDINKINITFTIQGSTAKGLAQEDSDIEIRLLIDDTGLQESVGLNPNHKQRIIQIVLNIFNEIIAERHLTIRKFSLERNRAHKVTYISQIINQRFKQRDIKAIADIFYINIGQIDSIRAKILSFIASLDYPERTWDKIQKQWKQYLHVRYNKHKDRIKPEDIDSDYLKLKLPSLETLCNIYGVQYEKESKPISSPIIEVINNAKPSQDRPVVAVFDVHGTLLNPVWKEEYKRLYKELLDKEPSDKWFSEHIVHKTDFEIACILKNLSGITTGEILKKLRSIRQVMREEQVPEVMPGALDMVKALHKRKVPIICISGTERKIVIRQLKKHGFLDYIPLEHVRGSYCKNHKNYDRNKHIKSIHAQWKNHTMVCFDDNERDLYIDTVKKIGGFYFAIPQGEKKDANDIEFQDNRSIFINAQADYILKNFSAWAAIDTLMTVPDSVQMSDKKILAAEHPAKELVDIIPAQRDNPISLYLKVSDDMKYITYYEVDDSNVYHNGSVDYQYLKKKKIITIPSTHLITPQLVIENELEEPTRLKLLNLLNQYKRYTEYKGIITSWDLSVDRDVWTTNIDTTFLHDRSAKLIGMPARIPNFITIEIEDPISLILRDHPKWRVYIPENNSNTIHPIAVMPDEPLMDYEKIESMIEIGVGGGHGALSKIYNLHNLKKVIVTDISIYALRTVARCFIPYLREKPDIKVKYFHGKGIISIDEKVDLIDINPPYIPVKPDPAIDQEGDPYRGTGLIREILKIGHKNLNPSNPDASIFINISSLAVKDFKRYIRDFNSELQVEVHAVGKPAVVPFKDYVLVKPVGESLNVPLKIQAIDDEWKQWLIKEGGLWEKKDCSSGHEKYWHTLQLYQIKLKKPKKGRIKKEIKTVTLKKFYNGISAQGDIGLTEIVEQAI